MPWVKLSDDFWHNPKVIHAGDSAAGLYARLLSYCGAHMTDGLVPVHMAEFIVSRNRKGLDTLVELELIDRMPTGSLHIRDYLEYNRSKADWDADAARRRQNGKQGGRPSKVNGHG